MKSERSKKKMVLGAALVVAIMALAGVGYAWSANFNGTTDATGTKTVDVDYVTLSLSSANYTTQVVPIGTAALYWDSSTAANGTTTYTVKSPGYVTYTYQVTIDTTALEATDLLKLTVTGLTAPSGYTISCTYDGDDCEIDEGTAVIGGAEGSVISNFTGQKAFVVKLTADSPRTTSPPTTAVFPPLTFTVEGTNVAAPAA